MKAIDDLEFSNLELLEIFRENATKSSDDFTEDLQKIVEVKRCKF